jgi:hypothetical protein
MPNRERIVVVETFDERDIPVREAAPSTELAEWTGTGPARGEWEAANDVAVEYLAPGKHAA